MDISFQTDKAILIYSFFHERRLITLLKLDSTTEAFIYNYYHDSLITDTQDAGFEEFSVATKKFL